MDPAQQQRDVIGEIRLQAHAHGPVLVLADLVVAIADVGEVPVAAAIETFDVQGHAVTDPEGRIGLRLQRVEAAVADLGLTAGDRARFGGGDDDRAAGRIPAEERALRAFQHLNAAHVEQVEVGQVGVRLKEAVHVDTDVGAATGGGDGRADTANGRLHGRPLAIEAQARRQLGRIRELLDVGRRQLISAKAGDADRHVARKLLAALRGNDDLVRRVGLIRYICVLGKHRRGEKRGGKRQRRSRKLRDRRMHV